MATPPAGLGGIVAYVTEPGSQSRQLGGDGSQQPIQLPRHASQGLRVPRLVGVGQTGVQDIHVGAHLIIPILVAPVPEVRPYAIWNAPPTMAADRIVV